MLSSIQVTKYEIQRICERLAVEIILNSTVHLTDDYSRARVKNLIEKGKNREFPVMYWANPGTHRHFKQLRNVKLKMSSKLGPITYHEFASAYVYVINS